MGVDSQEAGAVAPEWAKEAAEEGRRPPVERAQRETSEVSGFPPVEENFVPTVSDSFLETVEWVRLATWWSDSRTDSRSSMSWLRPAAKACSTSSLIRQWRSFESCRGWCLTIRFPPSCRFLKRKLSSVIRAPRRESLSLGEESDYETVASWSRRHMHR